jgi:hypothetical protein
MLHMLIKKIIPGDRNDKKVMQSSLSKKRNSLTCETKNSINSGLKKRLIIFSVLFPGAMKYLALSCILF